MKNTVAIVSLRFNPAFIQHLIAFAKSLREIGFEPQFHLDRDYQRFSELTQAAPITLPGDTSFSMSWSHAIFLNASAENRDLAFMLKRSGVKILYVYHEPWHMSPSYLWSEGIIDTAKAFVAHRLTVPVLKLADTVILQSQFGVRMYQEADVRYNRRYVNFPQIYDDDAPGDILNRLQEKKYFSYIGNLSRVHGFDQYLAAMRDMLRRGKGVRFLIASRHPLPGHVLKNPILRANLDRVEIRCGRPLTNEEINRCYAESLCVWNVYRRSTQSGVLPKAFMFGTPVLASRIGSFPEYVQDGSNGKFVTHDPRCIAKAIDELREGISRYAAGCRESFLQSFFYQSKLRELSQILGAPV